MTKTGFARLSEKAQWDIKVALRGPDSNYGETLKWFTTSVIRGQMQEVFRVGGLVNDDLKLIVIPGGSTKGEGKVNKIYAEVGPYGWNYSHFLDHVRVAAGYLEVPELRIETDFWHKVMQERSAGEAIKSILTEAEKWNEKWGGEDRDEEKLVLKYGYGARSLYRPEPVAELLRHYKEGKVRF